MILAPINENENERLLALKRYDVLDTAASKEFDDFTRLASAICGTPIALISLVDADRQWFKSKVGLDASQTPRDISFCGHAIHGKELLEIPNTLEDERFRDNPLVTGAPDIRFYAGEPLITADGYGIGTLCVIDSVPHYLTEIQRDALKLLGRLLIQQFDLQFAVKDQKKLNAELESQYKFRKALFDSAAMAIMSCDNKGVITSFNPEAEQLFGYSAQEVIGKMLIQALLNNQKLNSSFSLATEQVDLNLRPDLDLSSLKSQLGLIDQEEVEFFHKNGTSVPVEMSVSAIYNADNSQVGFLGIACDIAERKLLENTKSEFISIVSHELRTPLTSIRASLGLLEGGVLGEIPQKAAELISVANRNSERLIILVNDILDLDKLMSGKMTMNFESINLSTLVEQAIEVNTGYAEPFKVRYVLAQHSVTKAVMGDECRLMQVMANLLSNAAKFSKSGDKVEIRIIEEEKSLRVEVEDHGEGIPLEFQSKIFGKFSQANNISTRKRGGTGLGLSICYMLMQQMNGDIGFNTVVGSGTTFWFTVPKGD